MSDVEREVKNLIWLSGGCESVRRFDDTLESRKDLTEEQKHELRAHALGDMDAMIKRLEEFVGDD